MLGGSYQPEHPEAWVNNILNPYALKKHVSSCADPNQLHSGAQQEDTAQSTEEMVRFPAPVG